MTDKEYEHGIAILKKIEMKIMKDYHDLCFKCRCDVMLWADVFEKFRNNSLKNYRLCPSHFLSAPSLSWDATLKMTKINLELIPDPDSIYSWKKVQEVEFLIDIARPTKNI